MARRSMLGLAVLAVFLQGVGRAAGSDDASFSALVQMAPGRTDGWSLAFLNGQTTRLSLKSDGTGLIVTDTASTGTRGNWYFVGPAAFSGDMRAAYNGKLTFSIVQLSVADAKAKKDDKPKTKKVKKTTKEWELINDTKAIWVRAPSDVKDDEYNNFFKAAVG